MCKCVNNIVKVECSGKTSTLLTVSRRQSKFIAGFGQFIGFHVCCMHFVSYQSTDTKI
jgi:hypothetical protein